MLASFSTEALIAHSSPVALLGMSSILRDYHRDNNITDRIVEVLDQDVLSKITKDTRYLFIHEEVIGDSDFSGFLKSVKEKNTHCRACLIVGYRKIMQEEKVMTSGFNAIICNKCQITDIKQAIEALHTGSVFFSPIIASLMHDHYINLKKIRDKFGLTAREIEIFSMISDGLSSKEIARNIDISHRTVESHRQNILKKCNLSKSVMLSKIIYEES